MARVLIYAMNYAPEPTGVGRYTGDIGKYLAGQGHSVRVVTAAPHYPQWQVEKPFSAAAYQTATRDGARVTYCPILLKRPMRGIWRLLAPLSFAISSVPVLLKEFVAHRPNVVLCVEPTLVAAPLALLLSRVAGARTVLHVQDFEIEAAFAVGHLRGGAIRSAALRFESALIRRFSQVITISVRMRAKLAEKGIPTHRLALVRNWVDLDAIRPLQGRNRFREEMGLRDGQLVALYAGSVGAKQALGVALDAAQQLSVRRDILFVVAGDGPAKAGLMQRYGHLPNVRFLPPQPEELMCDLLNLADIHLLPQTRGIADLVLPSKLGGMLASGKPILVTADEGSELYEVLRNDAVVVPAGDTAAIARELTVFADGRGTHPAARDGRKLAASMARSSCLSDIALQVTGGLVR